MREVADGRLDVSATLAEEMSYCLGCLACQTACPAGVDYATLLEAGRGEVERRHVVGGPARRFMRWATLSFLFRHPRVLRGLGRLMAFYRWSGLQSTVRRSEVLRAVLPTRLKQLEAKAPVVRLPFSNKRIRPHEAPKDLQTQSRYCVALLTGCVQDLAYGHVNRATADVLLANGCEVETPPVQYCCGSLHAHNGELDSARDLARKNLDAFDVDELDAIISNAGGCGSHLRRYEELLHDDPAYRERAAAWDRKVRDIHEWLVEIGFRAPRPAPAPAESNAKGAPRHMVVAYDASCHLLHGQKIARQPLEILHAIPGVRLVPLPESDWCCGSAGVYSITQPEQSAKLLARKLDHIASTGATVLATGNPGCLLQIEQGMRADKRFKGVRVCHPVELLAEAYRREAATTLAHDATAAR
jgi:glycolate oxidase iron-sulfur subunit